MSEEAANKEIPWQKNGADSLKIRRKDRAAFWPPCLAPREKEKSDEKR
jgi:hypothetical protein